MGNIHKRYDFLLTAGEGEEREEERIGDIVYADKNFNESDSLHRIEYESFEGDSINEYLKT